MLSQHDKNELANIDWNSVLLSGSMEECYTSFVKELNDLFDKCIPYKRVKSRKQNCQPMDDNGAVKIHQTETQVILTISE